MRMKVKTIDNELAKHLSILRQYQDWRLGSDIRPLNDIPDLSPKNITAAIDNILQMFEGFDKPVTVCAGCLYNKENLKCDSPLSRGECIHRKENENEFKNTQTNARLSDLPF